MTRAVVLGGAGGIGSVAARTIAATGDFDEIVVADVRAEEAARGAAALGHPGAWGVGVDATSPASLAGVLDGADVAVSCIGPFYRFGVPVLTAAIDAGVAYVDVCDDLDATEAQLELDQRARDRGVCAVVGLGNSPGLANLLVRFAADELLDTCRSVDIMHVHGGEAEEGPAVIQHRIHAMVHDVPVFVDGRVERVRLLEESGQRFVEETEFRDVGTFPVYPYPHPETVTLPRHIPGLTRATNRGVVFPLAYFTYTMDVVRRGLAEAGDVPADQLPVDEWTDEILAVRDRLLAEAGVSGPKGCLKIVVGGEQGGEHHRYVFSVSSDREGAGAGTGVPAGIGAALVARGLVVEPGVHPPEAVVRPLDALAIAGQVVPELGIGGPGGGVPVHVAHVLPDGTEESFDLGF
ncbi:MAG: saccharopine dehydrogenase NADP-binding domain-containing protein [Actinomycetota bacterium]|jgi:saccharopine dehydrogenase (NAD+, L-lysine-forming)|nr:saccharopine dehydrogenase NADP-binding domain-containing protein [Actinomycetota bacterium]